MAVRAQHNYYTMRPVADVLDERVAVLSEAIPRGSVILDIGCNDGSISSRLLDAGVIAKSYGFDLEDILAHRRPELVFQPADLKTYDLTQLPDADGVIILNLLHHLIGSSMERGKAVIDYLIERYSFVIIDLGSFTEQGDWYWRRAYDKRFQSDGQLWNFLFEKAKWRFKLLRYPTQGKGFRTLWKLYRDPYDISSLKTVETFKRPPGAWPDAKKLIPIAEVGETTVVSSVQFELAVSERGDKFWVKRYTSRKGPLRAELEMRLATHAQQELEALDPNGRRDLRIAAPVSVGKDGELNFIYEPDVFAAPIVHFHDWSVFFTPEQCRAAAVLGTRPVEVVAGLPRVMLLHACDYQICSTWDGLTALDFEPNGWLTRLAELNSLVLPPVKQKAPSDIPVWTPPPSHVAATPGLGEDLAEIKNDLKTVRRIVSKLRNELLPSK